MDNKNLDIYTTIKPSTASCIERASCSKISMLSCGQWACYAVPYGLVSV